MIRLFGERFSAPSGDICRHFSGTEVGQTRHVRGHPICGLLWKTDRHSIPAWHVSENERKDLGLWVLGGWHICLEDANSQLCAVTARWHLMGTGDLAPVLQCRAGSTGRGGSSCATPPQNLSVFLYMCISNKDVDVSYCNFNFHSPHDYWHDYRHEHLFHMFTRNFVAFFVK